MEFFVIDVIKKIIEGDFTEIISNILKSTNDKCQKAILTNINDDKDDIFLLINNLKNKLKIKDDIVLINNINDYRTKLINYRFFKILLKEDWKFNVLLNLYKLMEISQSIIYCNNQQSENKLNKNLINQKFVCNSLDDDIKTITNFKKGQIRILTTIIHFPINLLP